MSDQNSDLTIRILQGIQSELSGIRQDNRGIHAELSGLREDNRALRQEMHEGFNGLNQRIDGVLALSGKHHQDLERRVTTLELLWTDWIRRRS